MTKANIAVIGAGWWSQGWHLPHVERNPRAKLVAIVETNPHPSSNLAKLVSREELGTKYPHAFIYSSVQELIANHMQQDSEIRMDGVIVATPHATHFAICQELMAAKIQLSMLLEKPMTASVKEAYELHKRIFQQSTMNFMINHTANYRPQAFAARDLVAAKCGRLRHAMISFASPLADLFNDPANIGWVTPTSDMIGNGFCWGQQAHPLAWFYFVCPHLVPTKVFCSMMHSSTTGADVAHSATILCRNNDDDELVVISCSGNTLLPDTSHSEQSVPKKISFQIYGDTATLFYEGDDQHEESGSLELRKADGSIEKPCGHGFLFENCDRDETGPESVQNLIQACLGQDFRVGADSLVGLRTVQTIDAMYKSQQSKQLEDVQFSNVEP